MLYDRTAEMLYLAILLGALGFYHVIANRRHLGRMVRHAVLWALIFIGVLAAVGLWQDVRPSIAPTQITHEGGVLEVPRGPGGHYTVVAEVNGTRIPFLIDTGASNIVLSKEDAEAAGIEIDALAYLGEAQTANGTVRTAPVRMGTFSLGGVEDQRVKAYVTDGALFGSLLGMDYLRRFEKIEISRDRMILTR